MSNSRKIYINKVLTLIKIDSNINTYRTKVCKGDYYGKK